MKVPEKEYAKMTGRASPQSPKMLNCIKAFLIGGGICMIGEGISELMLLTGMRKESAELLVPIVLIVLTAILTAFGLFDKIAKHAGAGTIVPITGFANSVVSPALEFSSEGRILGTGAEMFRIAGPVLVYGSTTAVLCGFIYWLFF